VAGRFRGVFSNRGQGLHYELRKVCGEFLGGSQSLHTFKNLRTVRKALAVAKSVSKTGTCAVVAAREAGRGLFVPVAVEGQVPSELAPELDVVGDIKIGVNSQNSRDYVEVDLVETEETYLPDNQSRCDLLV
jgi:hypothetical protein